MFGAKILISKKLEKSDSILDSIADLFFGSCVNSGHESFGKLIYKVYLDENLEDVICDAHEFKFTDGKKKLTKSLFRDVLRNFYSGGGGWKQKI